MPIHARWPALLLALCLLLAQGLGLVHRVEHGGHPAGFDPEPGHRHGHVFGAAHGASHERAAPTLSPDHEPGSAECRLYDQLGLADSLPAAATPTVAAVRPPTPPAAPAALRLAGACPAGYQARAPPLRA